MKEASVTLQNVEKAYLTETNIAVIYKQSVSFQYTCGSREEGAERTNCPVITSSVFPHLLSERWRGNSSLFGQNGGRYWIFSEKARGRSYIERGSTSYKFRKIEWRVERQYRYWPAHAHPRT